MREAPRNITEALKSYDSSLGVRWDSRTAVWILTRNGRDLFSLYHRDNRPVRGDLWEGEVMAIVRESDQRHNPRDLSQAIRRQRYAVKGRRERAQERMIDERAPEARKRARFLAGGRKVFSGGA